MTSQSISGGLPNPFHVGPSHIAVPISRVSHVPVACTLNSGSTGSLSASQCIAPFILDYTSTATGAFTLPDAFSLSQAYGNSSISTAISALIPGFSVIPSVQVQVGDVFTIPIVIPSTSSQGAVFTAGTGGTGSKAIGAFASTQAGDGSQLVIRWTAVGPSLATCGYTLQ
jgi:hypothetical protein